MSLKIADHRQVPESTAELAWQVFPKGHPYLLLRDKLGPIFHDEDFASLFESARGRPAESPGVQALVMVLQFLEEISDTEARHMVCSRIDWKYFLGLELDDTGFDASVLCEFRQRVIAGERVALFLERILALAQEVGVLKRWGRQRTDATHVVAQVRELNRLECVGEALRQALNALATVVPAWLRGWVPAVWYERYGQSFDTYHLPRSRKERRELALIIGQDGQQLLARCAEPDAPAWLGEVPAVDILGQIWQQQYEERKGQVRWRPQEALPPHSELICSPYEIEARYATKRDKHWTGYKSHLTEICTDQQPHLITHVLTTPSTTDDAEVTATIHAGLKARGLLPREHLVDTGYIDATLLVESREDHHVELVGPLPPDTSWQARCEEGFDRSAFVIDWEAQQVHCPQGVTSSSWSETNHPAQERVIHVRFPRAACHACPVRTHCTRAKKDGRTLTFLPQPFWEAQQERRQAQQTPEFRAQFRARAGVEGTISQGVRAFGLRKARYRGLAKTHLQHVCTAAAMNLARLADWWHDQQSDQPRPRKTRRSRFAALAPPPV